MGLCLHLDKDYWTLCSCNGVGSSYFIGAVVNIVRMNIRLTNKYNTVHGSIMRDIITDFLNLCVLCKLSFTYHSFIPFFFSLPVITFPRTTEHHPISTSLLYQLPESGFLHIPLYSLSSTTTIQRSRGQIFNTQYQ